MTQLKKRFPGIRIAVIAHGDYWDECIYVTKIKDFCSDTESICDFVKKVKATRKHPIVACKTYIASFLGLGMRLCKAMVVT